jgi:hypothetical protein
MIVLDVEWLVVEWLVAVAAVAYWRLNDSKVAEIAATPPLTAHRRVRAFGLILLPFVSGAQLPRARHVARAGRQRRTTVIDQCGVVASTSA